MDTGSWFAPEFAGERVPTLKEVITTSKGKIKLNIELKFNGHDKKLAKEVTRIVAEAGFEADCIVTSLEYHGVLQAKQANNELRVGLIVTTSVGDVTKLDVDLLSVSAKAVDRDLIHRARRAGKEVHVWTVNKPEQMNTMIHFGVDNIITDVPELLVQLLEEREQLSSAERLMLRLADFLEGRL